MVGTGKSVVLAAALAAAAFPAGAGATGSPDLDAALARLDATPFAQSEDYERQLEAVKREAGTTSAADEAAIAVRGALFDAYRGRIAEAAAALDGQATVLREAGPDYLPDLWRALAGIGAIAAQRGDFAAARQPLEEASAILNGLPAAARDKVDEAILTDQLGFVRYNLGERDAGKELGAEALALARSADPLPAAMADIVANRLVYLRNDGDIAGALEFGRETLAALEAVHGRSDPSLGILLARLSELYRLQGRPSAAIPLARRGFELAEAASGPTAQTAMMRAATAIAIASSGKWQDSAVLMESALQILQAQLGSEAEETRQVRAIYARILAQVGRADEALPIAREALASADSNLPPGHAGRIDARVGLAAVARMQGDYTLAASTMEEAVALRARIVPHGNYDLITERALLNMLRSRRDKAMPSAALADEAREIYGLLVAAADRDPGGALADDLRASFAFVAESSIGQGDQATAFAAQQWSARSTVDRAAAAAAMRDIASDDAAKALLDNRRALLVERGNLLGAAELGAAGEAIDLSAIESQVAALDESLAALDEELSAHGLDAARFGPVSLEEVKERLRPGEIFLQVSRLSGVFAVTAVARDQVWQYMVDGPADKLGERVAAVRASLLPASLSVPFDREQAAAIYKTIVSADLSPALLGASTIYIAANDTFTALPFSLLVPDLQDQRYLIDHTAIVRLPGPPRRVDQGAGVRSDELFAMGDVATGTALPDLLRSAPGSDTIELPRLPSAAAELQALASNFGEGQSVVLLGDEATEAALRDQRIAPGSVVAFATHGFVSGEVEGLREPALLLHREGKDDGFLTASEIARLSIPARWVILSACNTAAGAGPDAAGLSGLAQAFIQAGAENILATHWPVRDDVAAALSVGTLRAAQAGADPAHALRSAMLEVRGDSRGETTHPALWAPFEVVRY